MKELNVGLKGNERYYRTPFGEIYPLYQQKVARKGQDPGLVDVVITWLTGYEASAILGLVSSRVDFETFFNQAPHFNPLASKIKGTICGYKVELIEDPIVQKVRYLDKLIDEVAAGKAMEKVLRT